MRVGSYYPTYKFRDHDPILDAIDTLRARSPMTNKQIHEKSGVSTSTLSNWAKRRTKRPQYATLKAVARSLGGEISITANGKVIR